MEEFSRIQRLPPYVFNITGEMKVSSRRRGEDFKTVRAPGYFVLVIERWDWLDRTRKERARIQ